MWTSSRKTHCVLSALVYGLVWCRSHVRTIRRECTETANSFASIAMINCFVLFLSAVCDRELVDVSDADAQ